MVFALKLAVKEVFPGTGDIVKNIDGGCTVGYYEVRPIGAPMQRRVLP
jgi:hypothetical protein